jgi:hypothetical protein
MTAKGALELRPGVPEKLLSGHAERTLVTGR